MSYIKMAEAKNQLTKINDILQKPLFLVGGIAVNQYIITRNSEDIDLICDNDTAIYIIDKLYPSTDWHRENVNGNEYRPAYYITSKLDPNYPVIKLGPKLTERGLYEYLNSEEMSEHCQPFSYNNKVYNNIQIPSQEYLCYMKIVSFLGRDIDKKEKLKKDLEDIKSLSNNKDFRLDLFIKYIRRNHLENEINSSFSKRLSLVKQNFDDCSFGFITKLFFSCLKQEKHIDNQTHKYLVAFDVDGTLIRGIRHSWTLLWEELGLSNDFSSQRKKEFKNGKISYLDWVEMDANDLINHKFSMEHISRIVSDKSHCWLTKNLVDAVNKLKDNGVVVCIISGGVDAILFELLPNAGELFDEVLINRFIFDNEGFFKKISPTEYDWDDSKKGVVGKNRGLERLCEKYNIPIYNSIFVGDDLNDFKAMTIAGKRIFYCEETREFTGEKMPDDITIISKDNLMEVTNIILEYINQ